MSSFNIQSAGELGDYLDSCWATWNSSFSKLEVLRTISASISPEYTELKDIVGLEHLLLGLYFDGSEVRSGVVATTTEGETVSSPGLENLNPRAFEYIEFRAASSTNHFLKARYALLLWNAPKPYKNGRFGKFAFDELLAALSIADCVGEAQHDCVEALDTLCALSELFRHRPGEIVHELISRIDARSPFWLGGRVFLAQMVVKYNKLFNKNVADETWLQACANLFEECLASNEFHLCDELGNAAIALAQRNNISPKDWYQRLGQSHEAQAASRLDDESGLAPLELYRLALEHYRHTDDDDAIERVSQRLMELKPKIRLNTVTTKLSNEHAQQLHADIQQNTSQVLSMNSDEIYYYLTASKAVIPSLTQLREQTANEKDSLSAILGTTFMDGNKNTQRGASEPGAAFHQRVMRNYGMNMSFRLLYLRPIFIEGTASGKLSYESLRGYLESSWVSSSLREIDTAGVPLDYSWADLVYPSLREFFLQLGSSLKEGIEPSFVMCLDSLTVKFEGLLRDFARHAGINTTVVGRHDDLREMYVDEILEQPKIQSLFDEDCLVFFKYVFLSSGKNIRNDVAHCFYRHLNQYSLDKMILVICAFLRLAGFEFNSEAVTTA
ncbi:DUF4209 domain-containing protein [Hymenobacter busanensis]|uniref:DUF4209 domain-containing protein n=1 Tax=Hymenobacter busanensis TaxID=2607656 RepID=A0A7L4ZXP3_9BACT|nr:DUF4209 domain-containing protein [Hymenobacter busanensis]KAA9332077.1 DUF4209 domain-containing protein [Hymenobacter busanensis]QHJ07585.1 DUF4209 domain-containing protein [Hymenobacter busanensis]